MPSPIYYLLSFPLHATLLIFPEHLNISNTFIFYLYISFFILTLLQHNISFNKSFTLVKHKTYNYTIVTGSYPQVIHETPFNATGGIITCDKFIDVNGWVYYDWIPTIKLFL